MLDIKIEGLAEIDRELKKVARNTENAAPLYREIGERLRTDFTRNMTQGVDPEGRKLAPVQRWTRYAGASRGTKFKGKLVPLLNTGTLRAGIGTVSVDNKHVEFGFRGEQLKKAVAMYYGKAGTMKVRQKRIPKRYTGIKKARKDGHGYMSVRANGKWITKPVQGGKIKIKPKARKFFHLGRKQVDAIVKVIRDYNFGASSGARTLKVAR